MLKKILLIFLTIIVSLSLVGCKNKRNNQEEVKEPEKQAEQQEETSDKASEDKKEEEQAKDDTIDDTSKDDSTVDKDDDNKGSDDEVVENPTDEPKEEDPVEDDEKTKEEEQEEPSVEHYSVSYYDNYYVSLISWTDGEDLKQKLHDIISGGTYQAISYNSPTNYETNINADHSEYDFEYLDVLYSSTDVYALNTNTLWQREHCFPASLMTGSTTSDSVKYLGRATDFHNLWASSASANSSRGNKNYGVADKTSESYVDRTTNDGADGYSFDENIFEPGDNDKGKVARSIFYMATMYCYDEIDTKNGITMKGLTIVEEPVEYAAGNYCAFAIGNLSTLLSWNNFSVSDQEAQHNESVYSHVYSNAGYAQGNRNPYVDFPELVEYVFGSKKDQPGYLDELTPSIVTLEREEDGIHNYALSSALRVYNYGDVYSINDVEIVAVNNDFTTTIITEGIESLYSDYSFSSVDGTLKNITVKYLENEFTYDVTLKIYGECNFKETFSKTMFDNSKINTSYELSIGDMKFNVIVDGTSGYGLTNNNKQGGIKFGSGTKPVTKICLTSVGKYTFDTLFVDAYAANKSSSYDITIYVDDNNIYSKTIESGSDYISYGKVFDEIQTGIIKIEIIGTNALYLKQLSINFVDDVCAHSSLELVKGNPATCTENGTIDHYICEECGTTFLFEDGEYVEASGQDLLDYATGHHDLVYHEATLESAEYYECSCGARFSDSEGKNEIISESKSEE